MAKRAIPENSAVFAVVIALAAVFLSFKGHGQIAGNQPLHDSVPPAVPHLAAISRLPEGTHLSLAIGLPLRNEDRLNELLRELYDPASPNFHHYLTPKQFAGQFAPSASDYQIVADFFRSNGFAVTEHSSHMVLDASGTASDVERVFHVTMRMYHHPTENRTFFAPDAVPTLNLGVPILHVSGLDNYSIKRPKMVKRARLKNKAVTTHQFGPGSGPEGAYLGNDFRAAYVPGVSLTGAGQTVGLLEFDGYYTSDIQSYESLASLPGILLTNVAVDGGVSSPGEGDEEVALDIEMAMSVAPGLSKIVVYEAPQSASFDDILDAMANDTVDSPQEFSSSWGNDSPSAPDTTAENYFKQMGTQGQSFFNAVGDSDAFAGGIPFPSESTNIMQVGGTTMTTTGPAGAWVLETTWDWGGNPQGSQNSDDLGNTSAGSSGGISDNFKIPYWQQGVVTAANQGSPTMRNAPDVAMIADNVFLTADDGSEYTVAGTSCAAPAWAAFTALVNQQALARGGKDVGFINPTIYTIGKGPNYLSDFNDITTGNNFWASSTNAFSAVPGYDLCTGWGTPCGDNLIDALAGFSDALGVTPGRGFVTFGPVGGPFTANALKFSLTNSSASSLNWSLINTSSWLTVSTSSGVLSPRTTTSLTASLNAAAYTLAPGTYTAALLFSNETSHVTRVRQFAFLVGQNLVQNGGFESYPFSLPYWVQTGGTVRFNGSRRPTYNWDYVDAAPDEGGVTGYNPNSGTNFCVFNTPGIIGYISQSIPTVPGQHYLLSTWLMNPVSGSTEQFLINWNTNSATTNTIYNLLNPPVFTWSNVVLFVTATGTNTTLQFGARNDPGLFGLDDVSLAPIPWPNVNISKTGASASITWNALAGLQYQLQYSTNLLSPNWSNLTTNIAAGSTLSVTNPIGPRPAVFYRALYLP